MLQLSTISTLIPGPGRSDSEMFMSHLPPPLPLPFLSLFLFIFYFFIFSSFYLFIFFRLMRITKKKMVKQRSRAPPSEQPTMIPTFRAFDIPSLSEGSFDSLASSADARGEPEVGITFFLDSW